MSNYKLLKIGICDKSDCGGNIQFDKENEYYYCLSCHKVWKEEEWDCYMLYMDKIEQDNEFHEHTYDETLKYLNNL